MVNTEDEKDISLEGCSMEKIWDDVTEMISEEHKDDSSSIFCSPMLSPMWDCYSDLLWTMEEEFKTSFNVRHDLLF